MKAKIVKMSKNVENNLDSHYTPVRGAVFSSMSFEMIMSVLSFLSRLKDTRSTYAMPFYQYLGSKPTTTLFPRMGEVLDTKIFPCLVLSLS